MGSDWPVCLLATDYSQWFEILDRYASKLTKNESEQFSGGTAIRVYRLSSHSSKTGVTA
jgi:L-fuconolactonase